MKQIDIYAVLFLSFVILDAILYWFDYIDLVYIMTLPILIMSRLFLEEEFKEKYGKAK